MTTAVAPKTTTRVTTAGPTAATVTRTLQKHSYCVISTVSPKGNPHAVGVLYAYVDGALYIATGDSTRKAKNVWSNPNAAVCVPVRKYPVGPPFAVNFQGRAEVLARDEPEIARLLAAGKLKKIVGYGVIDEPDLCFIKITPNNRIGTYGLGVPLRELLRNPAHADRIVQMS